MATRLPLKSPTRNVATKSPSRPSTTGAHAALIRVSPATPGTKPATPSRLSNNAVSPQRPSHPGRAIPTSSPSRRVPPNASAVKAPAGVPLRKPAVPERGRPTSAIPRTSVVPKPSINVSKPARVSAITVPRARSAGGMDKPRTTSPKLVPTAKQSTVPARRVVSQGPRPAPPRPVVSKVLGIADVRDYLRELIDRCPRTYDPKHAHNTDDRFATFESGDAVCDGRYVIISKLGFGEFSTVWLAYDRFAAMTASFADGFVAIKATRLNAGADYEASLLEFILKSSANVRGSGLVELKNRFVYKRTDGCEHVCLVLPVLGPNLLCVIDPFRLHRGQRSAKDVLLIRHLTRCIVSGLCELDVVNVAHTDLKPENILCTLPGSFTMREIAGYLDVAEPPVNLKINKTAYLSRDTRNPSLVKLTDFGLSYMLEENASIQPHPSVSVTVIASGVAYCDNIVLQTREYRAPEIILNLSFGCRTDTWSLGCIAYELVTGDFLVDPKLNGKTEFDIDLQHLALMTNLIGDFPKHFINPRHRTPHPYLSTHLSELQARIEALAPRNLVAELSVYIPAREAKSCADFIMSCLKFDPTTRPRARELARHAWVSLS